MPPMGGTSGSSARPSFPSGPSTRAAAFSAAVVRDGASDSRCSTANSKGKSENELEMFSKSAVNARVNPSLRVATAGKPARTGILDARTKAAFSLGANAGLHARGRRHGGENAFASATDRERATASSRFPFSRCTRGRAEIEFGRFSEEGSGPVEVSGLSRPRFRPLRSRSRTIFNGVRRSVLAGRFGAAVRAWPLDRIVAARASS